MTVEPRLYPARERTIAGPARDLSAELNPEQAAAATHGDGPLLIIAGAGTGKTRTLVYRVAHLLERGVAPERILLLTFTRRAAQEMLGRAERLVGSASRACRAGRSTPPGTACFGSSAPPPASPRDFSIMDQGDAEDLMQLARAQPGLRRAGEAVPEEGNAALRLLAASQHRAARSTRSSSATIRSSASSRARSSGSSPSTRAGRPSAISSTTTTCCSSGR